MASRLCLEESLEIRQDSQKGQLITLEGVLRYRELEDEIKGGTFKHRIAEIDTVSMKGLSQVEAANDPSGGADDEWLPVGLMSSTAHPVTLCVAFVTECCSVCSLPRTRLAHTALDSILAAYSEVRECRVTKPLEIIDVEIIQGCGIVVTYSDQTVASYPPEELAELRPHRQAVHVQASSSITRDLR